VISETANPDVPFQPGAGSPEPTPVYSSATFRTFLAGLLAVGAMACLVRSLRPRVVGRQGADQGPRQERLFLRGAAVLFLLGFFWEVLRLEDRLSDWGRDVVSLLGLYYYRQSYQEAGLAFLAAAFAVVLILCVRAVVRRRTRLYPVLAGLALAGYVGLSLAAAASFHYLDTWERMSLVGASVVDLARAACVAAALALVCAAPLPRGK